ncbi:DUF1127 domain-containing protein [Bradyrhizobium liaoningense]|uniref:DUF1127 domain-containing protein n=1 Tax=Bradyrhizobium liaoningense TaxID=43992 RepID=UPI0005543BA4|nr:DUF1127 domain-containing protein [Bradyrhizobium liaoningense]
MKSHSRNIVRLVRPVDGELDGQDLAAWPDDRGTARPGAGRIGRQDLADTGSYPAPAEAAPDRDVGIFWSVIFSFMEGFALYGAALHPAAAMPAHAILAARTDWATDRETSEPAEPVHSSGRDGAERNDKAVKCGRVLPCDAQPARRWNWLRSIGEMLAVLPMYSRREREIRRTVAALMELDDRTLRDLGIHGRSEIEWAVRYGHDC